MALRPDSMQKEGHEQDRETDDRCNPADHVILVRSQTRHLLVNR